MISTSLENELMYGIVASLSNYVDKIVLRQ